METGITEGAIGAGLRVVEPHGEIDLATASGFQALLFGAIESGARSLVVDLDDVGFIDSTGIGVLLSARRKLEAAGGVIVTICSDQLLRRVFEVSGLVDVLNVTSSRESAFLRAAQAG